MKLLQSLEDYQNGSQSRSQLMEALDGELKEELTNPTVLLEAISQVNQWTDFPEDVTDLLKMRLTEVSGTADAPLNAYRGDDRYAFVCYSELDAQPAFREIRRLEKLRYNCYFDTGDQSSSMISDEFAKRLLEAAAFIYLISPRAVESQRCRRELTLALESNIPVIALFLEETEIPPGMRLSLSDQVHIHGYRLPSTDVERQLQTALERNGLVPNPEAEPLDETVLAPQVSAEVQPGTQLRHFLLEEKLGSGGMSLVFKAKDTREYGGYVAVKVLNPDFAQHPDARITLIRETAKTRELTHQNIVNVIDFDEVGPHVFMWMDFLDGESLSERLRRTPGKGIPADEAQSILDGIVDGLSYAHGQKIVHADFKPGNVMLVGDGPVQKDQVKIIDFGIARAVRNAESTTLDPRNTIYDIKSLGAYTEAYASRELIQNFDADPSDDVYALACIAYEMFTGEHPFDRKSALNAQQDKLSVPTHRLLTTAQHAAISRALAFARDDRTSTAAQFLREFRATPIPRQKRKVVKPAERGNWKLISIAAVSLILVAIATWYALDGDRVAVDVTPGAGTTFADCSNCPEMVVVPSGSFRQGGVRLASEQPLRTIDLKSNFALSVHEVTVAEFTSFVEATGHSSHPCEVWADAAWSGSTQHSWQAPGFPQSENHPVTCVSWDDARLFARWLSSTTGKPYRLPSASEWEYAAQASTARDRLCSVGNVADETAKGTFADWRASTCTDNALFTSPVGSYSHNRFGVADTLGNVFEWTADCWHGDYRDAPVDGSAVVGRACAFREARGGSWFTQPEYVYPQFRNRLPADTRSSSVGFRVARDL